MSISEAQSMLTLTIEAVALAAVLFFPAAIAVELVAGFRRHRSGLTVAVEPAAPVAVAAPVAAATVPAAPVPFFVASNAAPEPVAKVAPVTPPAAAVAPPVSPGLALVALGAAIAVIQAESAWLRLVELADWPLAELRQTAAAVKLPGRAKLKTRGALALALAVA
jgi:hypothetical protein